MVRPMIRWTALGMVVVVALASGAYLRDINRAYARVRDKSTVVALPQGDIEYSEGGAGTPVLVIHGSGGGFDQGELIAETFLGDDFHWMMNPVSLRSAGVMFDNHAALPGNQIAAIQAQTLIVHARDDTLQIYHNVEFAASTIPDAQ